ncbi:MAG: oligosaccharide repeat unit polymerase [Clostridia bacterium]|nr:oligosaccharide repeat unit polymerase [Clostridia bacterium]
MATEKEKFDKQNLLANLYSLRAGISLACLFKDKADSIIQNAKDRRAQLIEQSQMELNGVNNKSAQLKSREKEAEKELKDVESEFDSELRTLHWRKKDAMKSSFIFSIIMLAIVAVVLIMLYCVFYFLTSVGMFGYEVKDGSILDILFGWMFIWEKDPSYSGNAPNKRYGIAGFLDVVALVLILACIFGIIFLIICAKSRGMDMSGDKSAYRKSKIKINELLNKRTELQAEIALVGGSGEFTAGQAQESERELARVKNDTMALVKQASVEAKPYVLTATAIVAALDNTFTDLIDIRDWENLDYIIYCIETRRSDNMKEALTAVDRQRQTEQIVIAVEAAGREISRTLNAAVARLEKRMVQCFSTISHQLEMLSRQLSAIVGKLDDVITEQSMSNALLKMQNVTSMAMLGELNKISNATDYVARRISAV